jgi:multidrug efflux pump subunit AcrA (membrane-fusion protein)
VRSAEAALDQARQELQMKISAIGGAKADLERSAAMVSANRAEVSVADQRTGEAARMSDERRAAAFTASTIAGYTTIHSQLDGVVTDRLVTPPTLVQPGTPVLRLAEIDRVRVQSNVPLTDVAKIKVGAAVEIRPQKDPNRHLRAHVTAVFPAADPSSRTSVVEAVIGNPDRFYLPGDYVVMRIATEVVPRSVLTVPTSAIVHVTDDPTAIYGQTRPAVWTVLGAGGGGKTEYDCPMHPEVVSDQPGTCPKCGMDLVPREVAAGGGGETKAEYYCTMHPEVVSDEPGLCPKCNMELVPREGGGGAGTAHLVRITLGRQNGDRTEVTDGLRPGDQVIYLGQEALKEGDRVSVQAPAEVAPPTIGSVVHPPPAGDGTLPGMDMGGSHAGH